MVAATPPPQPRASRRRAARTLTLLRGLRRGAPDAPDRLQRTLLTYLGRDEHVVLATRQHPFAVCAAFGGALMLIVPLLLVAWGAAGIPLLRNAVGSAIVLGAFLLMVAVVARFAWQVLGWEFSRLVVTSEKVIHAHGILHRRIASTPLVKVSELTVSQSVFGRMFGYGSLVVDSPGGDLPLHGMTFIPQPARLYRLISDTARSERALEGGGAEHIAAMHWHDAPATGAAAAAADEDDDAPTLNLFG